MPVFIIVFPMYWHIKQVCGFMHKGTNHVTQTITMLNMMSIAHNDLTVYCGTQDIGVNKASTLPASNLEPSIFPTLLDFVKKSGIIP